jgi:hypothetical protein
MLLTKFTGTCSGCYKFQRHWRKGKTYLDDLIADVAHVDLYVDAVVIAIVVYGRAARRRFWGHCDGSGGFWVKRCTQGWIWTSFDGLSQCTRFKLSVCGGVQCVHNDDIFWTAKTFAETSIEKPSRVEQKLYCFGSNSDWSRC